MLDFQFHSPTEFVFGKKALDSLTRLIKKNGYQKVLVLYGGGSVIRSGLMDRVKQLLDEANIKHMEAGGIQPNPTDTKANELIQIAIDFGADLILGLGAGSVLDTAKAVAIGAANPEDTLWTFFNYEKRVTKALPVASIMTFPATGSEGSNSSVINFESVGLKRGLTTKFNRPVFALLNPEWTYTLPPYQTACGIVDMMSHIFERYFSNTSDVELVDRLAEATIISIMEAANAWIKSPNDYETRATLTWASTLAHNNILGVGREQDWSCHAMEHQLSFKYGVAHGAGLAVVTLAWMRYVAPIHPFKLAKWAVRVMGVEAGDHSDVELAELGIQKLRAFYQSIGMPVTFESLGCNPQDIPELVETIKKNPDGTIGQYVVLDEAAMTKIYELSCEQNNANN